VAEPPPKVGDPAVLTGRGLGEFDPGELVPVLSPLADADAASTPPSSLGAYTAFYGLDFAASVPGVEHSLGWLTSGAHRIVVQRFAHPRPVGTALVSHGYYDHVGLYGYLIEFLLKQRLSVVIFDQPGHGLSSGDRATIGSFDEYVQVLGDVLVHYQRVLPGPWYIIGQSMGGAVAMEYLARQPEHGFREVVLLAPLIRPANWRLARFAYLMARYTIKERPRTITDNAENPEFLSLMRRDPLAPMVLPVQWVTAMVRWMRAFETRDALPFEPLVVQGHADATVDWRHNLKVLRQKTRPTVLEIPAARHHLVNESELIRAQMFEWLAPRLGERDGSQ
jgi:alpha-beta hydrolase superfamily lysophospholipase